MELYEELRDGAVDRLIDKFGTAIKVRVKSDRVYDAATGSLSSGTVTDIDTSAVRIGAVAVLRGTGEYREGMVLAWNEGLMLSAKDLTGLDLNATHTIVFKGRECPILKVIEICPGDVVVAYKVGIVVK